MDTNTRIRTVLALVTEYMLETNALALTLECVDVGGRKVPVLVQNEGMVGVFAYGTLPDELVDGEEEMFDSEFCCGNFRSVEEARQAALESAKADVDAYLERMQAALKLMSENL